MSLYTVKTKIQFPFYFSFGAVWKSLKEVVQKQTKQRGRKSKKRMSQQKSKKQRGNK